MSDRTLKTIIGAVAALLLIYAATAAIGSGPPDATTADNALAEALRHAAGDDVDEIRITGAADTVALRRGADGWTANGHRADSTRVREFLEALDSARVAHLASANPDNHARLGVAVDSARTIEVRRTDGESVRLLIGDPGPSFGDAYVRLPDAAETYLVRGDLRRHATRGLDDWRDRTILALDTARVARLEIERGDDAYTLVRGDAGTGEDPGEGTGEGAGEDADEGSDEGPGEADIAAGDAATDAQPSSVWRFEDGAAADTEAVRRLLGELARLQATGFAEPDAAADTVEAFGTLRVARDDGGTLAIVRIASTGATNLRVTVEGDATVYELPEWRASRLVPERSEVAPEAPDG